MELTAVAYERRHWLWTTIINNLEMILPPPEISAHHEPIQQGVDSRGPANRTQKVVLRITQFHHQRSQSLILRMLQEIQLLLMLLLRWTMTMMISSQMRWLKDLRKNSFMMLILEESGLEEEDDGDETCSSVGRDMDSQVQHAYYDFEAIYQKYCERMLLLDRISAQCLKEAGSQQFVLPSPRCQPSPRSASKKLASPFRFLSLTKMEESYLLIVIIIVLSNISNFRCCCRDLLKMSLEQGLRPEIYAHT